MTVMMLVIELAQCRRTHFSLHPTWPPKGPPSTFPPPFSPPSILTFPKLVICPPKSFRNKAPRGRAAHPTGPAIRLSLPHFRSAGARLYGPDLVVAVEGGRSGRRWNWNWNRWNGHLPGPVRACADEFTTVFQGTPGEDAGNAGICDRLCEDVSFGECRPSEHDDDMLVPVLFIYLPPFHSRPDVVLPEMRTALRTYHPVPSLQKADANLQDAPRIKNILKACSLKDEAATNMPVTPAELRARAVSTQSTPIVRSHPSPGNWHRPVH